ncbi:MAG: GTP cyclohydrolase, FolE2/MptA family, partial [Acidiferrobacteraceae bacterium]
LNRDNRIDAYIVESENFESIHNHSAYALVQRDKRIPQEQQLREELSASGA